MCVDGVANQLKADVTDDFRNPWGSGEEADTSLPRLGVRSQLLEKIIGLSFDRLVARGIPHDLDGLFDLGVHIGNRARAPRLRGESTSRAGRERET